MKIAYLTVSRSRLLRRALVAVLSTVAVALLIASGWHSASTPRVASVAAMTSINPRLNEIQAVLVAESLNEVTIRTTADGSLSLIGWLPNANNLVRLKHRLSGHSLHYALTASDEVIRYLSEHLRELTINASVSYLGVGRFRVHGHGDAKDAFELAVARITQNLPAGAQLDAQYDWHESAKGPIKQSLPNAKAPARHMLTGIDAVVSSANSSYLTSGSHYVFSGGTLRDGAIVQSISVDRVEVVRAGDGATVTTELSAGAIDENPDRRRGGFAQPIGTRR
jgi:hypothetical protein